MKLPPNYGEPPVSWLYPRVRQFSNAFPKCSLWPGCPGLYVPGGRTCTRQADPWELHQELPGKSTPPFCPPGKADGALFQELLLSTAEQSRAVVGGAEGTSGFEVRVPRHWDFSVCSGTAGQRRTSYARPSHDTDILIGRSHPVFGSQPWSIQTGGCGQQGLVLNLPFAFLTQPVPNHTHKGGCKGPRPPGHIHPAQNAQNALPRHQTR